MPRIKFKTREEWLHAGVKLLEEQVFNPNGYKVPSKGLLVSVSFPSTGAFSSKNQRIGECWYPQMHKTANGKSKENLVHSLFISPILTCPIRALDVLTHELVHTITGPDVGHRTPFKRIALSVGLTGKMSATTAGPELTKKLTKFTKILGEFPHIGVGKMMTTRRIQTCRQLKISCPKCGYIARTTQQWLDIGLPTCVCGAKFKPCN